VGIERLDFLSKSNNNRLVYLEYFLGPQRENIEIVDRAQLELEI